MSLKMVKQFKLAQNNINMYDSFNNLLPTPKPIKTFEHAFHTNPQIILVLEKQKCTNPLHVECQAWPLIMSKHNVKVNT